MQTLSPTVFPCYAAADRKLARRIADFLERGANVRVFFDEGELKPGEGLAAKTREARTADIVVVLFSRESLPARWRRDQWEPALVTEPAGEGVRIAFVRCDDCSPPKVLAPMFEANIGGFRQLKRWLRKGDTLGRETPRSAQPHSPEAEVLGIAIADRPGTETVEASATAREFAHAFRDDFEAVVILECTGRSLNALAGDLGAQLGLRLDGPLPANLQRLQGFCIDRRFLIVLDGGTDDALDPFHFGGRCSVLISTGESPTISKDPIRAAQQALSNPDGSWTDICRHARIGRRMLHGESRLAELLELMQQWHQLATSRHDRPVMEESAREMLWILETWGDTDQARELDLQPASEDSDQMTLPFS